MVEFKGVVRVDAKGSVVCFCEENEVLRGKCDCQHEYDCPWAVITFDIIPGTRPSEQGIVKVKKATRNLERNVIKIREGVSQIERAVKKFGKLKF